MFTKPTPWGYRTNTVVEWVPVKVPFKNAVFECPHSVTEYPVYKVVSGPAKRMCSHCGLFDPPEGVD